MRKPEAKIADLEGKIGDVVAQAPGFQVFIPTFGNMADAAGDAAAAVGEIARAIRAVEREAGASSVFRKYMLQEGAGDIAGGKMGGLGDIASRRFGGIGGRGITGGPTDSPTRRNCHSVAAAVAADSHPSTVN